MLQKETNALVEKKRLISADTYRGGTGQAQALDDHFDRITSRGQKTCHETLQRAALRHARITLEDGLNASQYGRKMDNSEIEKKLIDLNARLDEAHKTMDKVNAREAAAVRWFGVSLGILSSLILGFQFLNSQRVDQFVERANSDFDRFVERSNTELNDVVLDLETRLKDALGTSLPRRVEIRDAVRDPNRFEFAAHARIRNGQPQLRLYAPYYVFSEGATSGLIGLWYRIEGSFVDYVIKYAWEREGAYGEFARNLIETGRVDESGVENRYNDRGFAILPANESMWFYLAFDLKVENCEMAERLFEELQSSALGNIEVAPVLSVSGVPIERRKFSLEVVGGLENDCSDMAPKWKEEQIETER